jgi:hypothetical protein
MRACIGIAALFCAMAITAPSFADSAYSVRVGVASHIAPVNTRRRINATGEAANAARLSVYLAPAKCSRRRSAEARLPDVKLVIRATVVGHFTQIKLFKPKVVGKYFACVYLTGLAPNPGVQYAAARNAYRVTAS